MLIGFYCSIFTFYFSDVFWTNSRHKAVTNASPHSTTKDPEHARGLHILHTHSCESHNDTHFIWGLSGLLLKWSFSRWVFSRDLFRTIKEGRENKGKSIGRSVILNKNVPSLKMVLLCRQREKKLCLEWNSRVLCVMHCILHLLIVYETVYGVQWNYTLHCCHMTSLH